jgi:type I restriction enzyme R subunit
MDNKEKKALSEMDICDRFITPAIKDAGWDPMQQIRREVTLTPGPVVVRGNLSSRRARQWTSGITWSETRAQRCAT